MLDDILFSDNLANVLIISCGALCLIGSLILGFIIVKSFFNRNPFKYPVAKYVINIKWRRNPSYNEVIEEWLIVNKNVDVRKLFNEKVLQWENECVKYLSKKRFRKKHNENLFLDMKEKVYSPAYPFFVFVLSRETAKDKMLLSNDINDGDNIVKKTVVQLIDMKMKLEEIGYETTLNKYHSKEQRKLMTRELREKIMIRDNYTCQLCGKYMPDEVGLQIDHIVSIKKGGKSVESNLQVLCDKCNGHKSSK